jgi:hypothetical protein
LPGIGAVTVGDPLPVVVTWVIFYVLQIETARPAGPEIGGGSESEGCGGGGVDSLSALGGRDGGRRAAGEGLLARGSVTLQALQIGAEIGSGLVVEFAVFFDGFVDDAFEVEGDLGDSTLRREQVCG